MTFDTKVRRWLCVKFGHKFYVGSSGHYRGMTQNRCWRCGKVQNRAENKKLPEYDEPIGGWFD